MRKPRVYLVVVGSLLASGLAILLILEREPEYGGKKLSEWVMKLADASLNAPDDLDGKEGKEALHHIGPKAIPYLLRWLRSEPSPLPPWRKKLPSTVEHVLQKLAPDSFLSDRIKSARCRGPAKALIALGPLPPRAVAQLNIQMQIPSVSMSANWAGFALASIGPQGIPSLMMALTNQSGIARWRGVYSLDEAGTNALPAVPLLIGCLKDADSRAARAAAVLLGKLRHRPDVVVPALAQCVLDVNGDIRVRETAAQSLKEFGPEALPVIGIVRKALDDPEIKIRRAVTNALRQIDPQSLKGEGR